MLMYAFIRVVITAQFEQMKMIHSELNMNSWNLLYLFDLNFALNVYVCMYVFIVYMFITCIFLLYTVYIYLYDAYTCTMLVVCIKWYTGIYVGSLWMVVKLLLTPSMWMYSVYA